VVAPRFFYHWRRDANLHSTGVAIYFLKAGTAQVFLRSNANGTVDLVRSGNNTILATSADLTNPQLAGAWWTMEVVCHGTTGLVNVYLGSSTTPVLTYTGNTLVNGGSTTGWDRVMFYTGQAGTGRVDDLILTDGSGTRIPEAFVTLSTPTGAGVATGGFTPTGAASNAAATDDIPVQSSIYAGSVTPGDEMTLAMSDVPAGLTIVPNTPVKVSAYASRDGTVAGVDLRVRSGGTDAYVVGQPYAGAGTFQLQWGLFPLDNAGNAWTNTSVNAMECGIRLT
jgi:hypothetical protein